MFLDFVTNVASGQTYYNMMTVRSFAKCAEASHLMLKPPSISFLADAMLGSIARKLRIFGFDTLYLAQAGDNEILRIGMEEGRVILTADKELFKRIIKVGARGVLLRGGASELE